MIVFYNLSILTFHHILISSKGRIMVPSIVKYLSFSGRQCNRNDNHAKFFIMIQTQGFILNIQVASMPHLPGWLIHLRQPVFQMVSFILRFHFQQSVWVFSQHCQNDLGIVLKKRNWICLQYTEYFFMRLLSAFFLSLICIASFLGKIFLWINRSLSCHLTSRSKSRAILGWTEIPRYHVFWKSSLLNWFWKSGLSLTVVWLWEYCFTKQNIKSIHIDLFRMIKFSSNAL